MADTKRQRDGLKRFDCGVSLTAFEATHVLLAYVRAFGHLLLRQPADSSKPCEVFPDQFAHLHASPIEEFER